MPNNWKEELAKNIQKFLSKNDAQNLDNLELEVKIDTDSNEKQVKSINFNTFTDEELGTIHQLGNIRWASSQEIPPHFSIFITQHVLSKFDDFNFNTATITFSGAFSFSYTISKYIDHEAFSHNLGDFLKLYKAQYDDGDLFSNTIDASHSLKNTVHNYHNTYKALSSSCSIEQPTSETTPLVIIPPDPTTNGDDNITGSVIDDIINGLEGNDTIRGAGGNDTIKGDAAIDVSTLLLSAELWFDALDATTLNTTTDEGIITSWANKGTDASNATPFNADNSITYENSAGHGYVEFANTDYLDTTFALNTAEYTKIFIGRTYNAGSFENYLSSKTTAGGHALWSNNGTFAAGHNGAPYSEVTNAAGTNELIGAARYDASSTSLELLRDGTVVDTENNANTFTDTSLVIGGFPGFPGTTLDGIIGETLVFNRALTDSEIDAINTYISGKWDIASTTILNYDDILFGDEGNDVLYGQYGNDVLWGGAGADRFVFEQESAYNGVDTIKDFSTAQGDIIDIADLLEQYDSMSHAISDFVQLNVVGADTSVQIDADGLGAGEAFESIALIEGVTGLNLANLISDGNLLIA